MPRACLYVSGHGFGHAARVQAVVERLLRRPGWSVELRSSTPRWFFDWVLGPRCVLHHVELDPGVVQGHVFHHDLPATLQAWTSLLARADELIEGEARHLRGGGFDVVLGDVVPLAFPAAARAGLPSLAMGNFTWDWILSGYLKQEPALEPVVRQLRAMYRQAGAYLRLPMSHPTEVFAHQRRLPLVARQAVQPAAEVRQQLGLTADQQLVLLSFGGVGFDSINFDQLARFPAARCFWDCARTLPGVLLSVADGGVRYTDLIRAADVILTKPGYSIIAEAVAQQTPLACVSRDGFRESPMLERYLQAQGWPTATLGLQSLQDGSWIEPAMELASQRHEFPRIAVDGAEQAARALVELTANS